VAERGVGQSWGTVGRGRELVCESRQWGCWVGWERKIELLCLGGERPWLRGEGAGDGADFWWAKMEENLLRGKQVVRVGGGCKRKGEMAGGGGGVWGWGGLFWFLFGRGEVSDGLGDGEVRVMVFSLTRTSRVKL